MEQPLRWENQKPIAHERYRLIFTHEYVDEKGEPYRVEEPILAEYILPRIEGQVPLGVALNEVIEALTGYLRKKVKEEICG